MSITSRVFSRDILKGGILAREPVVGGEDSSQGGEDCPPSPPLENTLIAFDDFFKYEYLRV